MENSCDGDCATRLFADCPCSEISAAIVPVPNGGQLPAPPVEPVAEFVWSGVIVDPDIACIKTDRGSVALAASAAPEVPCCSSDCR